jgi:hypothetical protein
MRGTIERQIGREKRVSSTESERHKIPDTYKYTEKREV